MDTAAAPTGNAGVSRLLDFDAVVIGAGVTGLYQLHRLRELGLRVRTFEAASGVGDTWYWNRYLGARFDSESWTYGYAFSQELLDEWDWSEHFSPQPDNDRYLNYVGDKFDRRRGDRRHAARRIHTRVPRRPAAVGEVRARHGIEARLSGRVSAERPVGGVSAFQ
jgi:cation diffusion facilitator CzcD-associated flavoprotein CzcO